MRQHQKQLKPGFEENNPSDRRAIEALKRKILCTWSNPKKERP